MELNRELFHVHEAKAVDPFIHQMRFPDNTRILIGGHNSQAFPSLFFALLQV